MRGGWTFAITAVALFMFALDRLIVTTALPAIRQDLGTGLEGLEWTVNAYTLTSAVLLLSAAAIGDRFGRRRVFVAGLAVFTAGSAAAALAPSVDALVAARALQGLGGAVVIPLSLTIFSGAVPAERRGLAFGAWGAVVGLATVLGPLVGGELTEALSWQWIFWVNVPLGLALVPLAWRKLDESRGPNDRLDVVGLVLASGGLLALVWGLIRAERVGSTSFQTVAVLGAGAAAVGAFAAWERRTRQPMLPLRFFSNRRFAAASASLVLAYFGLFGSLFLIAQFLQTVLGYSAVGAGLGLLPATGAMLVIVPIAGALSDRFGVRPLMATGLAVEAAGLLWLATFASPSAGYAPVAVGLLLVGAGNAAFAAPVAIAALGAVRPIEQGQASGAMTALRELAGVFGVAVLAAAFAGAGGLGSPAEFVSGYRVALWIAAAAVAGGAAAALAQPASESRRRSGATARASASSRKKSPQEVALSTALPTE
jgi:EmrB/QacA subfamily drug resistance transporter